ncbi:MAG: transthyretin-like family protein, partial [Bacteroidales bacterium]|nr:transthyretin-like family protein [Bacteroidales bacterium]
KAKQKKLLAETKTDAKGNYSVKLSDKVYKGQPVEIDVYCEKVPGQTNNSKKIKPVQFTITTIQPKWRETNAGLLAHFNYIIPNRFWCYILSLFDVWVICGKVVQCKNPKIPFIGVKVTAFDADWIKDDNLGSDTTDAFGRFRIYYTSKDFKQTFLSPFINVETPFPPYNSGPDVYFKIESAGGTMLMEETRSDGQQAGRSNIGNCFCIQLCVREPDDQPGPDVMVSAWTGIGGFTIPDSTDLNDFDADGHAHQVHKFALTGNIRFTGQAPHKINGNPVEYRFLVSEKTGVNGDPLLPDTNFTKVVGKDPGLFVTTRIGQMWRYFPSFKTVNIYAKEVDLDADGWLDVNKSILRTFTDDPTLNPLELNIPNRWHWVDLDGMMALNTRKMTSEPNVPAGVADAGQSVPAASKISLEKIAIRFEIREVINKATNQYNYLSGSGQTLNAAIVNNNAIFRKLVMDGHQTMPCKPLSGKIEAIYTVYHPYLDTVHLQIKKNDTTSYTTLDTPALNNTNDGLDEVKDTGFLVNGPYSLSKCTYIVRLLTLLRLHNGDDQVSWQDLDTSFYYDV